MIGSLPVAGHISNHTQIFKTKLGYAKYSSNRALPRKGFSQTGGWLSPRQVFAKAHNIVDLIRADAATAPITAYKLRGNVSALERSGGNVAVLTGSDGKLLVDAGITGSRPRIMQALATVRL